MGIRIGGCLVGFMLFSFLSFFSADVFASTNQTIVLSADEWCPYNCHPNTDTPGILVELAKAAWKPLGYDVDYQVLPWARAKLQAIQSSNIGLLGAGRGLDEQQFIYGKVPPLVSPFCFFTKPSLTWSFYGVKALEPIRLGTAYGYNYDGEVGIYVKNGLASNSKFVDASMGDLPANQNFDKLQADRLDVVLEDRLVSQYIAAQRQPKLKIREAGCIVADDTIYLVLPKKMKNAEKLMSALDSYITQSRQDGRFAKLLQKYGIFVKGY
ncbi:transporter substrate-binding domain-containing protein [Leeia sp. TBRC 13508]|uniref:Transporter substrate-binding domain-containing protein n=1 Tax=Leeia speluncae TaxID=2884804 RepID=A0ABS8D939_9NEIS|nr:transporter substrate-binding domain-containing protein [Leeia speluncae]MCB6184451.1 transporter substrate-binding domain-containing protein [Leeia speluncae]